MVMKIWKIKYKNVKYYKILSAHLALMSHSISVPRDRHANPAVKYCNKRVVVVIAQISVIPVYFLLYPVAQASDLSKNNRYLNSLLLDRKSTRLNSSH